MKVYELGEADLDHDGWIGLDELYEYVYEKLLIHAPNQTPGKWGYRQQGKLIVAKNKHPIVRVADLPIELRQAIENPFAYVREGAVRELEQLLHTHDEMMSSVAKKALEKLVGDDSRRVSKMASEVLLNLSKPRKESKSRGSNKLDSQHLESITKNDVNNEKTPRAKSKEKQHQLKGTVSIETVGGQATPVIYKDSSLPATVTQIFSTAADNQTQVEIHLVYGENRKVTDNVSLGRFIFGDIEPALKAVPQIKIFIDITANLKLTIVAKNETTGNFKRLGLGRSGKYRLTRDSISISYPN